MAQVRHRSRSPTPFTTTTATATATATAGGSSRARSRSSGNVEDLWTILSREQQQLKQQQQQHLYNSNNTSNIKQSSSSGGIDTYLVVVGQRGAGKSSFLSQFLNPSKSDAPKSTTALEYFFARRTTSVTLNNNNNSGSSSSIRKDVAHMWELGGGRMLAPLVSVPLTPETLPTAVVAIVLDMSKVTKNKQTNN